MELGVDYIYMPHVVMIMSIKNVAPYHIYPYLSSCTGYAYYSRYQSSRDRGSTVHEYLKFGGWGIEAYK